MDYPAGAYNVITASGAEVDAVVGQQTVDHFVRKAGLGVKGADARFPTSESGSPQRSGIGHSFRSRVKWGIGRRG
jgi:hypothetical protein